MTSLTAAQALGAVGFWVFELRENDKRPLRRGWQAEATRTPTAWTPGSNVGIFTERFGDDQALVAIDVDVKGKHDGNRSILELELAGDELPLTFEQSTPSGGRHLFYTTPRAVAPSVGKIGPALDIRSAGSYILGPGSVLPEGRYVPTNRIRPATAPTWLIERAGAPSKRSENATAASFAPDLKRTAKICAEYIASAPPSRQGDAGDHNAFKVACELKDRGASVDLALGMLLAWNERCEPPWPFDELITKIRNAYAYGANEPGVINPQKAFTPVEPASADAEIHPFAKLNREFAWTVAGGVGTILWETTDVDGRFALEMISDHTFRQMHASKTLAFNNKVEPLTVAWMNSPDRRSYKGLCFEPARDVPDRYNLFKGFSTAPLPAGVAPSAAALETWGRFTDHLRVNVARENHEHFEWIMAFICGIFQRPAERPNVAFVATGRKGAGKTIVPEIVGNLLGDYYVSVADSERLFARFNSAFERALVAVLEEAVWSGDPRQDSKLKDLITGGHRNIERKGFEPFRVRNYLRVFILGNEKWIVPASVDERRYAVFCVSGARANDRAYFEPLYAHILNHRSADEHVRQFFVRQLMEYPCADVDLSVAPKTEHLAAQVNESVTGPVKFLRNCLAAASVPTRHLGGLDTPWPDDAELVIRKTAMHDAYTRTARERMESRPADMGQFFSLLRQAGFGYENARPAGQPRQAVFPPLAVVRSQYEKHIGGTVDWGE